MYSLYLFQQVYKAHILMEMLFEIDNYEINLFVDINLMFAKKYLDLRSRQIFTWKL